MAFYEINGKKIFIDNWLKERIDKYVIPDLKRKDMDAVYVVDGEERVGKSVFGMCLGGYVASVFGTPFDISNICMTPEEFRKKICSADKNEVVICDEAHRGMASAAALRPINKIMKDLMMEMGQKNLFVLIILPTFFLLDKYVALFRSRGLFHVYRNKGRRGYWVYFNKKDKLRLYLRGKKELNYNCMKWPRLRGRFCDHYPIDEQAYREKKRRAFESYQKDADEEPKLLKRYKEQRDKLLWILKQVTGYKTEDIVSICQKYQLGLERAAIYNAIQKIAEKS